MHTAHHSKNSVAIWGGKQEDLLGKKFGRWTVIGLAGSKSVGKNKKRFLLCKCVCGIKKEVQYANLKAGISTSCGCYKRLRGKGAKPLGEASARSLFSTYKRHARDRSVKFELSFEDFVKITSSDCFYCGIKPHRKYELKYRTGPRAGELRVNGHYVYNGVDKVNAKMGYTLENSVPCCFQCNHAKNDWSKDEFLSWVKRIYEYQWVKRVFEYKNGD